jgi:hypothetical protein
VNTIDYPLSIPDCREKEFIYELRDTFEMLHPVKVDKESPCERSWLDNGSRLRELVLKDDPRRFLRWDVVLDTMFGPYGKYIRIELKYLKRHAEWANRWRHAIRESPIGRPFPYPFYPKSSGTLIQHAYHIAQFEDKARLHANEMHIIFEFGGGYGSMCRLIHNLGFVGKYIMYDLPYFSALQKYYLKSSGFKIYSTDAFKTAKNGIVCISDLESIDLLLRQNTSMENSLFVATWSISEAPISIRKSIVPIISMFENFLIAYQNKFEKVDNIEYFGNWMNSNANIIWHKWEIDHLPGNYYLIGKRGALQDEGQYLC